LCVGALVTLVGELHRDANGVLSMRPWLGKSDEAQACRWGQPREGWRTYWEDWSCVIASAVANDAANDLADNFVGGSDEASAGGGGDLEVAAGVVECDGEPEASLRIEKVLFSDNPELCRSSWPACCGAPQLCLGLWPKLRLGGCTTARALLGKKKGGQ